MNQPINIQNNKQSKFVLCISVFVLIYVIIFKAAAVGTVYENLWLFIVAAIFIIPVIALWVLFKNKFSIKSFYFYSLLISAATIVLLFA
jgi:hypothetical protein